MNRNTELHFAMQPNTNIRRSTFDMSHSHKTTFNTGDIVPIYLEEILPGDTFKIQTNFVIRMSTPIKPVMDNAFVDLYFFFVPNRLVWEHWQDFMGENKEGAWDEDQIEYNIPSGDFDNTQITKGTIADHMGLPTKTALNKINLLPFRAYTLIYNEWFRDENIIAPILIPKGENSGAVTQPELAVNGGKLLKAAKFHDYFTSGLPQPQKGEPVTISLGEDLPVVTKKKTVDANKAPLIWANYNQIIDPTSDQDYLLAVAPWEDEIYFPEQKLNQTRRGKIEGQTLDLSGNNNQLAPANLFADLSQATAITINQLREAFQIQKLLEKDARGGTRYIEIIKSHFGVTSPDARMQRPEYLGGKRIPINMAQVLQTSATNEESPQGNTAAFSLTGDNSTRFTKSFTEHGYIIGLAVVRTTHSYQQGVNEIWSRQRRFDFYWPALANIGEQPILNKEIYAQGTDEDEEVFAYKEAYAEYRFKPNYITGEFRSTYEQTLDIWHYGDMYESAPRLSQEWIEETKNNVDRTLAVQSSVSDQFLADFYFKIKATRPMPLYSIPGLIDHN